MRALPSYPCGRGESKFKYLVLLSIFYFKPMSVVIKVKDIDGNVHMLTPDGKTDQSIIDMAEEK